MHSGQDRRTAVRIPFHSPVTVYAAGQGLTCSAVDLSATGMLIIPPASARPGLSLRVVLQADLPSAINAQAVLVREGQARGRYAWGIHFLNLTDSVRVALATFIERRQRYRGVSIVEVSEFDPANPVPAPAGTRNQYSFVRRRAPSRPAGIYPVMTSMRTVGRAVQPAGGQPRPARPSGRTKTPTEVRNLYEEALADLEGTGKKKP